MLVSTNKTHTTCECNHLTNFAIIMNVRGIEVSIPEGVGGGSEWSGKGCTLVNTNKNTSVNVIILRTLLSL